MAPRNYKHSYRVLTICFNFKIDFKVFLVLCWPLRNCKHSYRMLKDFFSTPCIHSKEWCKKYSYNIYSLTKSLAIIS